MSERDDPGPYRAATEARLGRTVRTFSTPRRTRTSGVTFGVSRSPLLRLGTLEVPGVRASSRPWVRSQPGESIEACERGLRIRTRTGVLELVWEQIVGWVPSYAHGALVGIELHGSHGEQLRFGREVRDLAALFALVAAARSPAAPAAVGAVTVEAAVAAPPPDPRRCVVCGERLRGEAHYGNAWERARKKLPCCSPACAAAFDPDQHWLPSPLPPRASSDEQPRLRKLAGQRMASGDEAQPVVRELLAAGIDPATLRPIVAAAAAAASAGRAKVRRRLLWWFLTRRVLPGLGDSAEQRTDASFAAAMADLDRWEAAERAAATR